MSQPRRRRRRRRRSGRTGAPDVAARRQEGAAAQGGADALESGGVRRSRRRRRRPARPPQEASARSSEDLVRAVERLDRSHLTAPADGRTLEGVIGELQSIWGVPQSPQEYRITLKVAEERDARGERVAIEEVLEDPRPRPQADGQPRREKAPAAPRIGANVTDAETQTAPARRKRGRRRRRRGGSKPEGSG
jgi:hypothetical protein